MFRKKIVVLTSICVGSVFFFSFGFYQVFKRPDLTVIGVVKLSDGIGRQGLEIVEALKDKYHISFIHTLTPCYKD